MCNKIFELEYQLISLEEACFTIVVVQGKHSIIQCTPTFKHAKIIGKLLALIRKDISAATLYALKQSVSRILFSSYHSGFFGRPFCLFAFVYPPL